MRARRACLTRSRELTVNTVGQVFKARAQPPWEAEERLALLRQQGPLLPLQCLPRGHPCIVF